VLKRRGVKRFMVVTLGTPLLLFGSILVWSEILRHIPVAYDTTRILGPLRADGTVDYVAALRQRYGNVKPEENAAQLLVMLEGVQLFAPRDQQRVLDELKIGPLPQNHRYFESFGRYWLRHPEFTAARKEFYFGRAGPLPIPLPGATPVSSAVTTQPSTSPGHATLPATVQPDSEAYYHRPWHETEFPELANWLSEQDKMLDKVSAVVQRPCYSMPLFFSDREALRNLRLGGIGTTQGLALGLVERAMLKSSRGDIAGCENDLDLARRLGRLVSQGPTVIERLVGVNIESQACRAQASVAAMGTLSRGQAHEMRGHFCALPPSFVVAEAVDCFERWQALDTVTFFARFGSRAGQAEHDATIEPGGIVAPPTNFPTVLRELNRRFDGQLAAATLPRYKDRGPAISRLGKEQDAVDARAGSLESVMLCFGPSYSNAFRQEVASHVRWRLAEVALALAIYHADVGEYPETLEKLERKNLEVPLDIFADGPLHYQKQGNGYLLYSVGPNMIDDGGRGRDEGGDDIAVRAER
jgi:hypothetical protein